jgi:predicted tellurium resistance membrane protein TerC
LLVLVNRYPALVDGAFIIIAWVGIKLLLEWGHGAGYIHFEIPRWLSLGLIVIIFAIAFIWAKIEGPAEAPPLTEKAEELLTEQAEEISAIDGDVHK